jgi:hypothetical protein
VTTAEDARPESRGPLPREEIGYYLLFWVAGMCLIVSGLIAFAHGGRALGTSQILLGLVVGPGAMSLVALGSPRE